MIDHDVLVPSPSVSNGGADVVTVEEILLLLPESTLVQGPREATFTSIEIDSRRVGQGTLFCCIQGTEFDGHNFASEAIAHGATGCLTERDCGVSSGTEIRIPVGTARRAVALLSAAIVQYPARDLTMVGITGTNGKTTTAHLVSSIAGHAGMNGVMIGTLTGERTTPPAHELHNQLAVIKNDSRDRGQRGLVAMEVSSHALDQHRVDGIVFDVAVFTNLTQDHLDYHGSMEAYFEAKARLFEDETARVAIVWADSDAGKTIMARRVGRSVGVDWECIDGLTFDPRGTAFSWRGHNVTTPIIGRTSIIDLLLAAETCVELGIQPEVIADALAHVMPAPGRMQIVRGALTDPTVIVDYAHTPDALEQLLEDLALTLSEDGRLILVFGCGGDRDKAKRPIMGAIASRLADHVIVTSDNPRSEDPQSIIDQVIAGATQPLDVIVERAAAIQSAISQAGRHDVVVIAGKGHETTQDVAGVLHPFDDARVARSILGRGETFSC